MEKNKSLTETNKDIVIQNQSLVPTGDFEHYARQINKIPKLSIQEEQELAQTYQNNPDSIEGQNSAKKLVLHNMYLVIIASKKFAGYNLPLIDLAQEGAIGLMKAVKNFNPYRNVKLATYAMYWIEAEIKSFIIANFKLVKIGSTKSMKKLFFGYKQMLQKIIDNGYDDSQNSVQINQDAIIKQIAQKMNVSKQDSQQAYAYLFNTIESLDQSESNDDQADNDIEINNQKLLPSYDDSRNPEDQKLSDNSMVHFENAIEQQQAQSLVLKQIRNLNSDQQHILHYRYLTEQPKSLKQLAQELGYSLERIRQIEKKSIQEIKNHLHF